MAATDYDFQSTRNEVIARAFRIIGALSLGESLSSEMSTQGILVLNDLVKSWQNDHIFIWTLKEQTQTLSASTSNYTLPTDPAIIAIDQAYMRVSSSDYPISIISWRQYNDIPNKSASGRPTSVCLKLNGTSAPTMYVYPVPTATSSLYYLGVSKLKDFDTASGSGDFPEKFKDAIVYCLADNLADEYPLPIPEKNRISQKAASYYRKAIGHDLDRADDNSLKSSY